MSAALYKTLRIQKAVIRAVTDSQAGFRLQFPSFSSEEAWNMFKENDAQLQTEGTQKAQEMLVVALLGVVGAGQSPAPFYEVRDELEYDSEI